MNLETIRGRVDYTAKDANYQGERLDVLDEHFRGMLEKEQILCAGYALSRNGKMFANNALGDLSCLDRGGKPLLPTSTFAIASITKVFTAVAIMKLVEDGKLTLDQPVGDFLVEFKGEPLNRITVLHLLNHTSGLIPDDGTLHNDFYTHWSKFMEKDDQSDWILAVAKQGVRANPGEEWGYCTIGYALLGEIISRVSGEHAHDYIINHICRPCEMYDTTFEMQDINPENCYIREPWMQEVFDELRNNKKPEGWGKWRRPNTGGGIWSTCEDLIKFGNMLVNNGMHKETRVIGRKALEAMFRNTTEPSLKNFCWDAGGAYKAYGVGIDLYTWQDKSQLITPGLVTHEGYGPSCLMVDPQEKFVAVWSAQFKNYDVWYPQALRNVASIMWSGII